MHISGQRGRNANGHRDKSNTSYSRVKTSCHMAHALIFVLVMHQQKNDWTTEQMLQLWEHYVLQIEQMSSVVPVRFVGEA